MFPYSSVEILDAIGSVAQLTLDDDTLHSTHGQQGSFPGEQVASLALIANVVLDLPLRSFSPHFKWHCVTENEGDMCRTGGLRNPPL